MLRAGSLATAGVSLSLAAHTAAGGHVPGPLALAVPTVLAGCAAVLVTGRRVGRLTATGGLVLAQAGLHAWFSMTSGHGCALTSAFHGHLHGAAPDCGAVTGSSSAAAASGASSPGPGLTMLLAHLVAVLLTGLLLAHGEALLWRLVALAPTSLRRVLDLNVRPVHLALRRSPPVAAVSRPVAAVLGGAWSLRGPPAVPAAG